MRLAVLGLWHETNTFAPVPATLAEFESAGIHEGDEIRAVYSGSQAVFAGYADYEAEDPDVQLVPLLASRITPMGPIAADAYEHLVGRMVGMLRDHGPWDGVLLLIHGAAVAESCPDADGELIRRVRATVGPGIPVGATLDLHANVSPSMVGHADVLTVYQTNPHVDARDQGLACARLIGRMARGEIRPQMALVMPPLAINILRQGTDDEPMAGLLRTARRLERRPGVLSVSLVEGFPYADVPEMGMSVLAIADGDQDLARQVATELADAAWLMRDGFVGDALPPDEALARADTLTSGGRPVVLLDTGDNVFGGSPGDSTHLLHAARRLRTTGVLANLCDADVVAAGERAGVGGRLDVAVGGKTDDWHGRPISVRGTVTAITDGSFEDLTPTHGGFRYYDVGPMIAMRTDDQWELVITSRPIGTTSRELFRSAGLEPGERRIIVAKGVHSPRPAFEPIAADLIWVATDGSTSADLSTLGYRHRRRPMFPFEATVAY